MIAIKYVDVHLSSDACHPAIRTQLPVHQMDVGLVLSVSRYPYLIVLLQVGSHWQIAVYKGLADVKDWLPASGSLHQSQPGSHSSKEHACSAHFLDLTRQWLHIQHGGEVSLLYDGMLQEEIGLLSGWRRGTEEVVCAHLESVSLGCPVVFLIEWVEKRLASVLLM